MKIYTLTLNPAYDVHAYIETFAPYHENLAQMQSKIAGGKGVNISRALVNAGIEHTAVVVVGNENASEFTRELQEAGLHCFLIEKDGRIRENLTFHCGNAPETRISFAGFALDPSIFDTLEQQLIIDDETYVTFTGRNPSGITTADAMCFLKKLQAKGAKIILDSKSFGLEDMYELKPWLIKPNQEEISELLECEIHNFDECVEKAKIFSKNGIENVMVSLGEQGALLISNGEAIVATPPQIKAVSTIGAGDSSIAGFLCAAYQNLSATERIATAVSFGTAACMTEGTEPPEYQQTKAILKDIKIQKI